ncbi:hypothetical protein N7516_005928 [Penicillium verrucosum]|uniref:uncharacterized protein n=1 Tax=Penicillium verrucosum TaxID=60171 RepID=UPI0025459271|nr:uncharacterized protein N7516_005928 [Penicillium verrucosum]KAJ5931439.1 hypothetical protein N7516_005928 [Penicillium verrucosum]
MQYSSHIIQSTLINRIIVGFLIQNGERGTEDLTSVDSDSRPSIGFLSRLYNHFVRIGRQMRQIGGINHHPPLRPRASPTEHSKKKPTCGPNFSLLSGFDPFYNIFKIAIHTNQII